MAAVGERERERERHGDRIGKKGRRKNKSGCFSNAVNQRTYSDRTT
jgi:hypothetical protein